MFQVFLDTVVGEIPPEEGKTVQLPPYSPDFNPIERLWQHLTCFITLKGDELDNKIIASLRSAMDQPETICSVCSALRLNRP